MHVITVYRASDALSWLPMRVRVNTGGYEKLTPKEEATLKTKQEPFTFQVRLLGMKKEVKLDKEVSKNREFEVRIGTENNGAYAALLMMILAVILFVMGLKANPMDTSIMAIGLIFFPFALTILYTRITIVPVDE